MYKNNGRWTYRVFLVGLGKLKDNNYFWICSATGNLVCLSRTLDFDRLAPRADVCTAGD